MHTHGAATVGMEGQAEVGDLGGDAWDVGGGAGGGDGEAEHRRNWGRFGDELVFQLVKFHHSQVQTTED